MMTAGAAGSSSTAGAVHLVRLVVRLDRLRLPLWLTALGGAIAASAATVPPLYDTPAAVAGYAGSVGSSPVNLLMSGRQAGLDTMGGIVANEISQVAPLGTCLMVMFLVARHTRAEEECGRAELVRSTAVGRRAALLAPFAYAAVAAALVAVITCVAMLVAGLAVVGSLTYAGGLALLGVTYAAATLVAAQVTSSARGAIGIVGAAVALGYLARGVGAMGDSAVAWASPFGWAQRMDPFGTERWWPALLLVSATILMLALADLVGSRRDLGGGIRTSRPGRRRATGLVHTPVGLVARLQLSTLVCWAVGLAVLALLYGAVVASMPDLVAANPDVADVVGASGGTDDDLVDTFVSYIFVVLATVSCGFVVSTVLRLRTEESSGRADAILATPVRRNRWLAAFVTVAFLGAAAITLLMGLALAAGHSIVTGDWSRFAPHVGGQLAYLPGTLVVGAFAVALCGLAPRLAGSAWALVTFVGLEQLLGQLIGLPDAVAGVSPYAHLAAVPVEDIAVAPVAVLVAVAGAMVLAGAWGLRRRDVRGG